MTSSREAVASSVGAGGGRDVLSYSMSTCLMKSGECDESDAIEVDRQE
jgi:hypothetical protein